MVTIDSRFLEVDMMDKRPEYDLKVIGANLKKSRLRKGLSVEQVRAYMMLGSPQAIYKWERGDGLPQADTFMALLELYNIADFSYITEEEDEMSSSFLFLYVAKHVYEGVQ